MVMPLRKALWRETINTVDELLHRCGEFERLCREEERLAPRRIMRVHEVHTECEQGQYGYAPMQPVESQVDMIQVNRNDLDICWNCRDIGHVFSQCSKPQMSVFCFTCGMNGVISVNCPKCTGNSRRGQSKPDAARPNQLPPNQEPRRPVNQQNGLTSNPQTFLGNHQQQ